MYRTLNDRRLIFEQEGYLLKGHSLNNLDDWRSKAQINYHWASRYQIVNDLTGSHEEVFQRNMNFLDNSVKRMRFRKIVLRTLLPLFILLVTIVLYFILFF